MTYEARSAGAILDDATDRTGWNYDSQIEVLLGYIENQEDIGAFADYIAERVENEESL